MGDTWPSRLKFRSANRTGAATRPCQNLRWISRAALSISRQRPTWHRRRFGEGALEEAPASGPYSSARLRVTGMPTLRDGTKTSDAKLDRIVQFDPNACNHPVTDILAQPLTPQRTWRLERPRMGDQKNEGACIGSSSPSRTSLRHRPSRRRSLPSGRSATSICSIGRRRSAIHGPAAATPVPTPSMRARARWPSCRLPRELGFFDAYHWAFTLEQVVQGILGVGPAVLGTELEGGHDQPTQRRPDRGDR